MVNTNTFYKTFSSSDTVAFMIFPESKPILLGSLTTLSHSTYREKKPVPLLGKINVGGYTRGMRSIAGTMVFTLINQHLVEDIIEQIPYLNAHGMIKSDELPFFDIMIICANEYGSASQMYIYGAEFFEDGQVISIQDLFIENTFSFVARDIDNFSRINPIVNSGTLNKPYSTEALVGYAFSKEEYDEIYRNVTENKDKIGDINKVIEVQTALKNKGYNIKVTGVENNETVDAIKKYQAENNLTITGTINDATYHSLISSNDTDIYKITNRNGTYVYSDKTKTNILGIARGNEDYVGEDDEEYVKINFGGTTGYIMKEDTDHRDKIINPIIEENTESGKVYNFSLDEFKPETIGAQITANKQSEYKISTLSYYSSGDTLSSQRYYTLQDGETKNLNLSYLSNSFVYNMDKGMPYMVEFVITSVNTGEMKKWTVKLK